MLKKHSAAIIKEIKGQYNTIAEDWHTTRQTPSGLKIKLLKKIKPGQNVLDLGCGNGLVAGEIMKLGGQYFGIDISEKLIKIARQQYSSVIKTKQASFRVGDATKKLPYKDNYFDLVFSFAVFHHVPGEENRLKFLQEIKRVLKTGGTAVIINWNLLNDWPRKRFGILEQINNPAPGLEENDFLVGWKATPGKQVKRYIHNFTAKELKSLAKQAGFGKITTGFYNRAGEKRENGEELVLEIKNQK